MATEASQGASTRRLRCVTLDTRRVPGPFPPGGPARPTPTALSPSAVLVPPAPYVIPARFRAARSRRGSNPGAPCRSPAASAQAPIGSGSSARQHAGRRSFGKHPRCAAITRPLDATSRPCQRSGMVVNNHGDDHGGSRSSSEPGTLNAPAISQRKWTRGESLPSSISE